MMDHSENWLTVPIGAIAYVGAGNPAPQREECFSEDGVPFVRVQDMGRVSREKYLTRTKDKLSAKGVQGLRLFPRGTKLKAHLRKAAERTIHGLWEAIGRILDLYSPQECQNYFSACGYDPA
jgi:hypothetical protein